MNIIIFCVAFVLAQSLQAAPLPEFDGTYLFAHEKLKVTSAQRILLISVRSEEAKNYILQLKADGFQCLNQPNSLTQCKKFDRSILEDQTIRADLSDELSMQPINFELTNNAYEQINDSPDLKEYLRKQNSSFSSAQFDLIHLYLLSGGLVKFKLSYKDNLEAAYFYLNTLNEISEQVTASKKQVKQIPYVIEDRVVYLYEAVWINSRGLKICQ